MGPISPSSLAQNPVGLAHSIFCAEDAFQLHQQNYTQLINL